MMTVGFGVVTNEFLLLAADGRQSSAYESLTDEAEKIYSINDMLAVVVFGAVIGSDLARDFAVKHIVRFDDSEVVERKIQEGVCIGVQHVMDLIPHDDPPLARTKVGLIAGGIDASGPYLVGSLFGTMMDGPSTIRRSGTATEPVAYIVLGGEGADAQNIFGNELMQVFGAASNDLEVLLHRLLHAVQITIQHTATRDSTVGGRIQYRFQSVAGEVRSGYLF